MDDLEISGIWYPYFREAPISIWWIISICITWRLVTWCEMHQKSICHLGDWFDPKESTQVLLSREKGTQKMTWSSLIIIFSSLFLHVLGAMLGYTGAKCHIVGWVYILYLYIPLLNPSTSTSHSIPINNRIDTVNTDTDGRFYGTATIFYRHRNALRKIRRGLSWICLIPGFPRKSIVWGTRTLYGFTKDLCQMICGAGGWNIYISG